MAIVRPTLTDISYKSNKDKVCSSGHDYVPNREDEFFTHEDANELKHAINENNIEINNAVESVEREFESRDNEIADLMRRHQVHIGHTVLNGRANAQSASTGLRSCAT